MFSGKCLSKLLASFPLLLTLFLRKNVRLSGFRDFGFLYRGYKDTKVHNSALNICLVVFPQVVGESQSLLRVRGPLEFRCLLDSKDGRFTDILWDGE